nr:G protein-coupled receptor [Proales similis]
MKLSTQPIWCLLLLLLFGRGSESSRCKGPDSSDSAFYCVEMSVDEEIRFEPPDQFGNQMATASFLFKQQKRPFSFEKFFAHLAKEASKQNITVYPKLITTLIKIGSFQDSLENVKGVEWQQFDLSFEFTNFDYKCDEKPRDLNSSSVMRSRLAASSSISFRETVKYNLNTCLDFFANVDFVAIEFFSLTASFLRQNQLSFVKSKSQHGTTSLRVKAIKLNVYNHPISRQLLPDLLVENTEYLSISGKLSKFEAISWPPLVYLRIANLAQFIHSNVHFLKDENKSNATRTFYFLVKNTWAFFDLLHQNRYSFPDEDFCLFGKHLLSNEKFFVMFFLADIDFPKCSCTAVYISARFFRDPNRLFIFSAALGHAIMDGCTKEATFQELVRECDFEKRLKLCENPVEQAVAPINIEWTQMDWAELFMALKYYSIVWMLPIITLVSIILNSLNALILHKMIDDFKKKRNEANAPKLVAMYRHLQLHSVASVLLGFIFAFKPASVCVSFAGPFCSSLFLRWATRLYKLVFIDYAASALFLFSNLNMLWFTLLRFRLNSVSELHVDSSGFNSRRYSAAFLLVSVLFALPKLFTASDYAAVQITAENPLNILEKLRIFDTSVRGFNQAKFPFYELETAFLVLKDILLPLVTFVLDFALILQLRAHNKARQENLNIKGSQKNQHNMSKMIAINGMFFFILRIPDLVATVIKHKLFIKLAFRSALTSDFSKGCSYADQPLSSECENIAELGQVLYLTANLVTFVLLFKFNELFRVKFLNTFNLRPIE